MKYHWEKGRLRGKRYEGPEEREYISRAEVNKIVVVAYSG
jgi:hypothetical protein